jgi:hypothetical protein
VPGVLIILFILLVAIPVGFLMTMAIVAGVLGWTVESEVAATSAGSEEHALAYPGASPDA